MTYEISQVSSLSLDEIIIPNFIYNRFDLWETKKTVCVYRYRSNIESFCFETNKDDDVVCLGVYLKDVSVDSLKKICKYLIKNDKSIKRIEISNSKVNFGLSVEHGHYRIELPNTREELESRLSKKGRYNLKREKRILKDTFGEYEVINIPAKEEDSFRYWEFYFENKKITHGCDYKMSPSEYISKYHVTDIYALQIKAGNRIAAVVLSCEQCPIAYIENLTYDVQISEYSPGSLLYDEYLKALIQKGIKEIYLLGGGYFYKKRYGSLKDNVYDITVYKNPIIYFSKLLTKYVRSIHVKIKKNVKKE